jgi:bifunctional enzyme CysN/CysC
MIVRPQVAVVVAGHVDHGKSTLVGRLLVETGNVPESKLEEIQQICNRQGRPLEYAYLLDALKDEQAQGITIERTRCFLRTPERNYLILDAPGHVEFIRNMVTGASRADAALLVIDAVEGVRENSRRHGFLLSMLGVSQIAVCVNKMDAVGYDPKVFEAIRDQYSAFLRTIGISPAGFIPVSAREGGNIAKPCLHMPWHGGPTVMEMMHDFCLPPERSSRPFRMPVQDVYRHHEAGVEHRMVVGRIESGTVRPGERVVFHPSGKEATIRSVERFQHPPLVAAQAGESIGVTLDEQLYIVRGEILSRTGERLPQVGARLRADVLWLGRVPLKLGQPCLLKLGNAEVPAQIESIMRCLNSATLEFREGGESIERHQVAECIVRLRRPIACDPYEVVPETGRFVLVENHVIAGGGIIREILLEEVMPDVGLHAAKRISLLKLSLSRPCVAGKAPGGRHLP